MSDTTVPEVQQPPPPESWFNVDVQRGLAWTIVLLFAAIVLAVVTRLTVGAPIDDITDLVKTLTTALINIVMVVVGFFFGSSRSSQTKDDTIAKAVSQQKEQAP